MPRCYLRLNCQMALPRILLCLLPFVCGRVQDQNEAQWAEFDKIYKNTTVEGGALSIYKYHVKKDEVVRVHINSTAPYEWPLLVVFREQRAIVSVQLPVKVQESYLYNSIARTLCPFAVDKRSANDSSFLSVEFSSYLPADFSFSASLVWDFQLKLGQNRNIIASPSEPVYLEFEFPEKLDSVMVKVTSAESYCMTISVQPTGCPVFDLENNVISIGLHQTMTKSGSIAVQKRFLEKFYVIFVVHPNDDACSELKTIKPNKPTLREKRRKQFQVQITNLPTDESYIVPVGVFLILIAVIYIASAVYMISVGRHEKITSETFGREALSIMSDHDAEDPLLDSQHVEQYGAIEVIEDRLAADNAEDELSRPGPSRAVTTPRTPSETTEDEYDTLDDRFSEKAVVRAKLHLTVADLSLKTWKQRDRKYTRYTWSLLTIALFYGLPVVQLVLTWLNTVRLSGDLDLCWYNFLCARPMLGFFAFNSVFSNIGYVLLGALLVIMIKDKERLHRSILSKLGRTVDIEFGIPVHNGLMYAIGIAIMMEGIMSASYHVCPSSSNYQFDTSFMYMIGALGMLKIYQLRHPDVNANAHVSFAVMALFIFLAMCGVYFNNLPFWFLFGILYVTVMFSISLEFYFKGQWRFRFKDLFRRIRYALLASKRCSMLIPRFKSRFLFLFVGNALNLTYVVLGILRRPKDFPSFLLLPFIANLFLYLMYYIVMKLVHHEKLGRRSVTFLLLACFCWGSAMWFFFNTVADWSETAAKSRELNKNCILFNFYDNHDVWHFLSSLALFLSFATILSIDDDLLWVPRNKIAVF